MLEREAPASVMDLTTLPAVSAPVPWHQPDWQRLQQQVEEDRLPHALLLAGEADTGVTAVAMALARRLLCSAPVGGLNCGECPACLHSASGVHGDFLWVQPEEKSRTIKIDQVRSAVQFVAKTPGYGERKVVVFAPADAMNTSAFNALLKSLEEPAPGTYLILACRALHAIPPTIRSRCQLRHLVTPNQTQSLDWLQSFIPDAEAAEQLLSLAKGRPLLARRLFEQDEADAVLARRVALETLVRGELASTEAATLWSDIETEPMLEEFVAFTQDALRAMPPTQLQAAHGRDAFGLLDELGQLQRAVSGGSNPGRAILADAVLAKFHRVLGRALRGDNIARK